MSKQDALQFLRKVKTDEDAAQKMQTLVVEEGADEAASIASVAANFGLSFSENELQEAVVELKAAEIAQVDFMEISDVELEQVVGGGITFPECVSTYEYGVECTFDDSCTTAWRYYKIIDGYCEYTLDPTTRCLFLEQH